MTGQEEFDLDAGRADRDTGIAQVLAHAGDDWTEQARTHIAHLAGTGEPFTADTVIAAIGMPPTGSRNIVGAVFDAARMARLIVRVGDTQAQRRARHASRVSVWRGAGHV